MGTLSTDGVRTRRTSDPVWRRIRLAVLQRDDYRCQVRSPVCIGEATVAGHTIPGDDRIETLRAECKPCSEGHWTERLAEQAAQDLPFSSPAWL